MTVKLSPVFNDQALLSNGAPAVGYKLFTYAAGSSTKQTTYTDSAGAVPQTNPIILNSLGYPTNGPIWLTSGQSYKFALAASTDTDPPTSPIKTIDNVTGVNDTSTDVTQWASSGVTPTYVSASSFTLAGDQTSEFHIGRRIQCTVTAGTVYGVITASAYTTLTTVTVSLDSGALDSGLSAVNMSVLRADKLAIPSGVMLAAGDVGFGIAPVQRLHVSKTVAGGSPASAGSAADPNAVLRIQFGANVLDAGAYASGHLWLQGRLGSNYATNFDLAINPNGGNVGIGCDPSATRGVLQVAQAGITGGSPQASGSTDSNQFAAIGNNAVSLRMGLYASGSVWIQPSLIGNYAVNLDTILNPNGGDVYVGGATKSTATKAVYSTTTAKAWVNFDGTLAGTISPRAAFNVTSITKNATGDYTLNLTNALADTNYIPSGAFQGSLFAMDTNTKTTSAFRFLCRATATGTATDNSQSSVSIFGN